MTTPQAFEIKDFRQPLVTSLGIILGFLLGFLGQWITESDFALKGAGDVVTLVGTLLGALLLFIALFRMLSPDVKAETALQRYRGVLRLYCLGVVIPMGSLLLSAFI
jgi:hypothetical protein